MNTLALMQPEYYAIGTILVGVIVTFSKIIQHYQSKHERDSAKTAERCDVLQANVTNLTGLVGKYEGRAKLADEIHPKLDEIHEKVNNLKCP